MSTPVLSMLCLIQGLQRHLQTCFFDVWVNKPLMKTTWVQTRVSLLENNLLEVPEFGSFNSGHNIHRGFQISKQLINFQRYPEDQLENFWGTKQASPSTSSESNPKNSNLEEPWHPHKENLEKNFHWEIFCQWWQSWSWSQCLQGSNIKIWKWMFSIHSGF